MTEQIGTTPLECQLCRPIYPDHVTVEKEYPEGIGISFLEETLAKRQATRFSRRTLQRRLERLISDERIISKGKSIRIRAVSLKAFQLNHSTTSSEIIIEDQQKMGLSPGLLRIALGYTGDLESRMEQMKRVVRKVLERQENER